MNDANVAVKEFGLESGFTVEVTPLPPYYMDVIDEIMPEKSYPKRMIKNVAGDEFPFPYEPPDEEPDIEDREDYDLYIEWHSVDAFNEEVQAKKNRAKRDFLLSMCMNIVDGPVDLDDDDWQLRLEGVFHDEGFKVPDHPGAKRLLFLKTVVITTPLEMELLTNAALFKEVTKQGIMRALQGFQDSVER